MTVIRNPATGETMRWTGTGWEPVGARAAELTHPAAPLTPNQRLRQGFGEAFGLPPSEIDLNRGVPQGERFGTGVMTDTGPEEAAYYSQRFPDARIVGMEGVYGIQPKPGDPVQFSNPPGADIGDATQFLGEMTLPGLAAFGAAGKAAKVGGLPGAAIGMGAQAGAELAREGIQKAYGTQQESPWSWGGRAALAGGAEGLGPIARGIKNLAKGKADELGVVLANNKPEDIRIILEAMEDGIDLPKLQNWQKSDSPVLQRVAYQSMQFSAKAQKRLADQLNELSKVFREGGPELPGPSSADALVQRRMKTLYEKERERLVPAPQPEEAGLALQKGVKEGLDTRKQAMREGYDRVDEMVKEWNPKYDLSGAASAAKERERLAMPLTEAERADWFGATGAGVVPEGATATGPLKGQTTYQQVGNYVNVADPSRKLARINAVLSRIDPRQDYEVVKELRSQVGSLLDMPYARRLESGMDIGRAKQIYGELSQALEDPQDLIPGARKNLIDRTKAANQKARSYYDTYDQAQVKQVLSSTQGQAPIGLYKAMSGNPAAFETAFKDVLSEAKDKPAVLGTVRRNLERTLMAGDDPAQTFATWQKDNPGLISWLYPDDKRRTAALQNARYLRDLNSGPAQAAAEASAEEVGFALHTLKEAAKVRPGLGKDAVAAARSLVQDVGGPDSEGHLALRKALWTDLVEGSMDYSEKTGNAIIDPKKLNAKLDEFAKQGWDKGVMSPRDLKALDAMKRYAKRAGKSGDAGTGLAVASQIGQLRRGDPIAAGSIWTAHRMAGWLTNTEIPFAALFQAMSGNGTFANPAMSRMLGTLARQSAVRGAYDEPTETER